MNLEDSLSCCICLEPFQTEGPRVPKSLPCQHTLCNACSQRLTCKDTVECPTCREQFAIPPEGFRSNFALLSVLSALSGVGGLTVSNQNSQKCGQCLSEREQDDVDFAVQMCTTCEGLVLCKDHASAHPKAKSTKGHNLTPLPTQREEQPNSPRYCAKHESKELQFFCEKCLKMICVDCSTTSCRGHTAETLKNASIYYRAEIEELLQQCEARQEMLQEAADSVSLVLAQVDKNTVASATQIHTAFDAAVRELESRKRELLTQVMAQSQKKSKALSRQHEELSGSVALLQSCCDFTGQSLGTNHESHLLIAKQMMENRLQLLADESLCTPLEDNRISFVCDPQPLCAAISSFGAVLASAPHSVYKGALSTHNPYQALPLRAPNYATLSVQCVLLGVIGSPSGLLRAPYSVSVSNNVHIFVTDTVNHRVQVFGPDGSCELTFGSKGAGPGQFQSPRSVSAGKSILAVADSGNHRVQVFKHDGTFLTIIHAPLGSTFRNLKNVFVDPHDQIFVAADNELVQVFQADGTFLHTVGLSGVGNGQLQGAYAVTRDHDGRVLVADNVHQRVHVFGADGSFQRAFGSNGLANGQFMTPYGLAVDMADNILVADYGNHRIQVLHKTCSHALP